MGGAGSERSGVIDPAANCSQPDSPIGLVRSVAACYRRVNGHPVDLLARRLLFNVLPAVMVGGMVYFTIFGSNGLVARHRLQDELAREQRRLTELEAENATLRREIRELGGDATALQRAAAEDLQLVPSGSTVYRFK